MSSWLPPLPAAGCGQPKAVSKTVCLVPLLPACSFFRAQGLFMSCCQQVQKRRHPGRKTQVARPKGASPDLSCLTIKTQAPGKLQISPCFHPHLFPWMPLLTSSTFQFLEKATLVQPQGPHRASPAAWNTVPSPLPLPEGHFSGSLH